MPTFGELIAEINSLQQQQRIVIQAALNRNPEQVPQVPNAFDVIRRKYMAQLAAYTKRNVIVYATRWAQGGGNPDTLSITQEDIQAFMEVLHALPTDGGLDLILHSPGGSAEATEALVTYLRTKFSDIRIFIPHAAMSAATMLACSANRLVMGKHSFIGPIDPQFILQTETGPAAVPAQAILDQFEFAQQQCQADQSKLPSWIPILRQYGPALLIQCKYQLHLAQALVSDWLTSYMFVNDSDRKEKSERIAAALADHNRFKSHRRFISREIARGLGFVIDDLESDQELQDLVLTVFHAVTHTFNATPTAKIVENHLGKAWVKAFQQPLQQIMQFPRQMLPPSGP